MRDAATPVPGAIEPIASADSAERPPERGGGRPTSPRSELLAALRAAAGTSRPPPSELHISRPSLYALIEANPRLRKAGDL